MQTYSLNKNISSWQYPFFFLLISCSLACKKNSPIDPPPVTVVERKDYKDFDLNSMAAKSGYYITDTLWNNGDISELVIRKSFDHEFFYPISDGNKNLYLGSAIDGKYFMENNGVFKEYTKFKIKPLSFVTADVFEANNPRFKYDVKIVNIADMDNLVKDYLSGAKPSLYGFSRYDHSHFSNYNQLSLFFGENADIKKLFKIPSSDDLTKVENGLVYYNMKETIGLKFILNNKAYFEDPFSLDEVKNDEAGFINKVTYGKISIMTVDSKVQWREMRAIIVKIDNNQGLSVSETESLKSAKIYTYLRGYNSTDQEKLANTSDALEKIKTFLAVTNLPKASNNFNSGTFTYGDHGVPIFFEINSAYSSDKFLKNFNYSKSIKFNSK